jgi:hypothetical protein
MQRYKYEFPSECVRFFIFFDGWAVGPWEDVKGIHTGNISG